MGVLPAARLLGGAVLSLGLALLLGRVFCSWICPYGFFSELAYRLRWRRGGERLQVRQAFWGKTLLLAMVSQPKARYPSCTSGTRTNSTAKRKTA